MLASKLVSCTLTQGQGFGFRAQGFGVLGFRVRALGFHSIL